MAIKPNSTILYFQKERVEKREIVDATWHNYVKPIKLFCEMSDIHINWKGITRGLLKGKSMQTIERRLLKK